MKGKEKMRSIVQKRSLFTKEEQREFIDKFPIDFLKEKGPAIIFFLATWSTESLMAYSIVDEFIGKNFPNINLVLCNSDNVDQIQAEKIGNIELQGKGEGIILSSDGRAFGFTVKNKKGIKKFYDLAIEVLSISQ